MSNIIKTDTTLSVRVPTRIAEALGTIAARENNRRSQVTRRLLSAAVARELLNAEPER